MTYEEAKSLILKIEYTGIAHGLMFSDWYDYKPESKKILEEVQKEIPALKLYDGKFRLIRKI
jgi:hypothetical protein